MFKDLFLSGGIGFDVEQLLLETAESEYKNVWLCAVLLQIQHITSLSSLLELRRQLLVFVDNEVVMALVSIGQGPRKEFLVRVFEHLYSTGEQLAFDLLARLMVDPGEQYPRDVKPVLKTDDFRQVFHSTGLKCAKSLLASGFSVVPAEYSNDAQKSSDFLIITLRTLGY